jgi:hypothetical protein
MGLFCDRSLFVEYALAGFGHLPHREHHQHYQAKDDLPCHYVPPLVRDFHRASEARSHQLKFRISERAHFRQVETFQFAGGADALPHQSVYRPISEIGDREHDSDQRGASDDHAELSSIFLPQLELNQ